MLNDFLLSGNESLRSSTISIGYFVSIILIESLFPHYLCTSYHEILYHLYLMYNWLAVSQFESLRGKTPNLLFIWIYVSNGHQMNELERRNLIFYPMINMLTLKFRVEKRNMMELGYLTWRITLTCTRKYQSVSPWCAPRGYFNNAIPKCLWLLVLDEIF